MTKRTTHKTKKPISRKPRKAKECPDCGFPNNGHDEASLKASPPKEVGAIDYREAVRDPMTKDVPHSRKVKRLPRPKVGRRPLDELLGVPRLKVRLAKKDEKTDWATVFNSLPREKALDLVKVSSKAQEPVNTCSVAPPPPIRYPATWWDAVKARWVPTWVYKLEMMTPPIIVEHQR